MNKLKALLVSLAVAGLACTAQAIQITGGISLAGGALPNTGDISTATSFSFTGVNVTSVSGAYGVLTPFATPITQNNLVLPLAPGGINPLWFVTATPGISFDLKLISSDVIGSNTRTIQGMGVLHFPGYDDTPGTWVFTANEAAGTFSFSSSNGAVAPDGGTTVALLGVALAGLAFLRRKIRS
jgi:hypothetical protein